MAKNHDCCVAISGKSGKQRFFTVFFRVSFLSEAVRMFPAVVDDELVILLCITVSVNCSLLFVCLSVPVIGAIAGNCMLGCSSQVGLGKDERLSLLASKGMLCSMLLTLRGQQFLCLSICLSFYSSTVACSQQSV